MNFIYNALTYLGQFLVFCLHPFNSKLRLFYRGRKGVISKVKNFRSASEKVLWIHAASLGEYEQGRPILEALKKDHPQYKILLSVFSPSAYEVIQGKTNADLLVYLPIDTPFFAKRFVKAANAHKVIFIKYEVWPNYLKELEKSKTPTYLIAAPFRAHQIYFKSYGVFFKKALFRFSHILTQDKYAVDLLSKAGYSNAQVGGDPRFDRVIQIAHQPKKLDFLDLFIGVNRCMVFGSSWPEDEQVYLSYINQAPPGIQFIIAPHNIHKEQLDVLVASIEKKTTLFSQMDQESLSQSQVFILDTIGLLSQVYAYADIAYIGGGFKTGLHNVLEATTYGIPVLIGPHYEKFNEAKDLVLKGGLAVVRNRTDFIEKTNEVLSQDSIYQQMSKINKEYTLAHQGATQKAISLIMAPY